MQWEETDEPELKLKWQKTRPEPEKGRKERRDKGRFLLTERDALVLRWIGEQYGVRLDQLARLLGRYAQRETLAHGRVSVGTARRVLERWRRAGLVESDKFRLKEPPWVWLTRHGLSELGFSFRDWKPNLIVLDHIFWVNEVRLYVEERRGRAAIWVGERTLRAESVEREFHVVDAEVMLDGRAIAVEVELTPKKAGDIEAVMHALAARYRTVWYFTAPTTRPAIVKALASLPESLRKRFMIYELKDMV